MTYDRRFFDSIRDGSQRSAAVVVPLVVERFEPQTVVDVGCGEGLWGKAFEDAGCDVLGLDGHPDPIIPAQGVDLTDVLPTFERSFDLAVCLEVAEHLPPERAETFIAELCGLSDTVLFSAAVPGQGGTGHLNERWPQYWVDLFAANGLQGSGALRWSIWNDESIKPWYRQNLLVFGDLHGLPQDGCPAVVHPVFWTDYR